MKRFWIVLAFVVTFGFTVLGWIGSRIYQAMPPIPERIVTSDGQVVAPEGSIRSGQGVSSEVCNFSHLYPLSKQKYKLIEGRFPLRNRLGPLFGDVLQAHIQHFHDRLVIGEHTAPFQHLPQGVV